MEFLMGHSAVEFKVAKDRLTHLFCGNAKGDFKCKPFLFTIQKVFVYLKTLKKDLSVFWRANKKAWMG